jgi:ABC-2 type transport system ATP-binding protein
MRVAELLRYTAAFYPGWDAVYAEELRGMFGLDPDARIQTLSKGQKARAGLLIALAYRPELLLLDEPSSGLDPMVRRDILAAVLRTIAEEGRTVLFSSHLLEEVEQVADQVTMIRHGRIVVTASLPEIREAHGSLEAAFLHHAGAAASTPSPKDP